MTYSNEDSLICSKCGSKNSEGSLFCSNCGATLTKEEVVNEVPVSSLICSKCGTDNSEGSLFCSNIYHCRIKSFYLLKLRVESLYSEFLF